MDETNNVECENCGGTDFTTEVIGKKITIKKSLSESSRVKLTSWETFNYILFGLVQELKGLGADANFERITCHLWMKYLNKLECIADNPKLGAVHRRRDAELVFQRKYKRKRKGTSSNVSIHEMDDKMKYSERAKQRKLMEKAEYTSLSQTLQSESTSLANQTLSQLSSDDESSKSGCITYTKKSKKELLRHMTKAHLEKHIQDINNTLTCHKVNQQLLQSYSRGPEFITKNKLYGVMYLGLCLSQQDIQLGDLLRFLREGHLSFFDFEHLFPDIVDNLVDQSAFSQGMKKMPTHEFMRIYTYQLYKFLDLRPCDFSPNMVKLCRRYCTELNLPDQIYNIAGDYIVKTRPFQLNYNQNFLPNYEGRCMGFIIYVLKLLLGIDDVTEYELSKLARLVNKNNTEPELFNFEIWKHFIEYRKVILKHNHFPTWHLLEPKRYCSLDLYIKFMRNRKNKFELDDQSNIVANTAKKFLNDILLLQDNNEDDLIDFNHSLTPFKSYLDQIKNIPNFKILGHTLDLNLIKDNSNQTVEYLIDPDKYLSQINSKEIIKIYSNAHSNIILNRITPIKGEMFQSYQLLEDKFHRDFSNHKAEILTLTRVREDILNKKDNNIPIAVDLKKILKNKPKKIISPIDKKIESIKKKVGRTSQGKFCKKDDPDALPPDKITPVKRSKWHVSSWNQTVLENEYNPNLSELVRFQMKRLENFEKMEKIKIDEKTKFLNKNNTYKYHYIPRMEYCCNIVEVSKMSKEKFREFELTLPENFQWLLNECARILEQSTKDLYEEFLNVEIYMNYIYFGKKPFVSEPLSNHKILMKMANNVEKIW